MAPPPARRHGCPPTPCYAVLRADSAPSSPRKVPASFTERQRREFLEIAGRAKAELNASFALVAIGLQLYLASAELARRGPPVDARISL